MLKNGEKGVVLQRDKETHAKTHDRMARLVEGDGLETIRQAVGISLAVCDVVPAAETI